MIRPAYKYLLITLAVMSSAVAVYPQSQAKPGDAALSGFRAEFLRVLDDTEKKIVSLAETTPQEKYSWRPMDGVRSISEVYTHMAGGNFRALQPAGIKPPAGAPTDMEKVTDKAKVVEVLKQSFAHVRQAAQNMADADIEKTVTMPGRTSTVREVLFRLATGMREHLGQSVAYARMNRIVPPWTAEREAQQKAKQ